ncbi:MAG TPA: hypothetical protein VKW04_18580 [Planctomycetota bacterium]|nr:hypothetical protein [Planctomycetota bacterium]
MKSNGRSQGIRAWGRHLSRGAVPVLLAAALFALLPRESRSREPELASGPDGDIAKPCGEWHRGAGVSAPLDLASVKRAYAALRDRVATSLDRLKEEASFGLDGPFDTGLPACTGEAIRTERLSEANAGGLRGKRLYFVAVPDSARLALPPDVARDPRALVLVVRARSLRDLPDLARAAGRPISLGSAGLAKALGVRCANTWLQVSEKGDTLELHETR